MHPDVRRPERNYILFSDVHLGADLVQHVRPWTVARLKQVARIDRDLASMIDWYRERRDPDLPWRLVIAGDLVDFVGMSIAPIPGSVLEGELTQEERAHGLGSTERHAASKMRAVARRHTLVFERLAAFLDEGHSLVIVRGNHDIDFHWPTVQRVFVDALLEHLPEPSASRSDEIEERVQFRPWFYYEEGLLYVEHGHQFDAMCSYHHLLAPVSPHDPERICWSFSDILLRCVVRPTRGLASEGHDDHGLVHYLRLAWSMGVGGAAALGYRYVAAILRGLRRWRGQMSLRARAIRIEHERRMEEVAERMRIGVEKLKHISGLWPTPVTRGAIDVLRSVFVDWFLVAGFAVVVLVTLALLLPIHSWVPAGVAVLAAALAYFVSSHRRRTPDIDPRPLMRRGALQIAELLRTRYVVMGHTHHPVLLPVNERSTYVNLGYWGVDDLDGDVPDAPRTHLVIRWVDGKQTAELLRWVPGQGPLPRLDHLGDDPLYQP